jgi:hypothetical protein
MAGSAWLIIASLSGFAGVGVLRASWSRHQRLQAMNLAGWSMVLGATLCGAAYAGAWGVAVAALSPMTAAFIMLALAAIRSTPAKVRAASRHENRCIAGRAPVQLAGRSFTFLLVAVLAAVFGLGIATAAGGVALLGGAGKSDAYATALFMMPLAWSMLAFALLMQPHRRGQLKVLAIASIPTWPCLAAGTLS